MPTVIIPPQVNPTINFASLLTLLTAYLATKSTHDTAVSTLAGLTIPTEPTGVADETAWDTYITAVDTYNASYTSNTSTVTTTSTSLSAGATAMIAKLPPNCWTKITVSSTDYWIGYHTNVVDPEYVPKLFVQTGSSQPANPLIDGAADPY